jgi:hypothetical protein
MGIVVAAVVVVIGILANAWTVNVDLHPSEAAPTPTPTPTLDAGLGEGERSPREFVYLDAVRATAYLSQLEGGNETLKTISKGTNRKLTAGLELGPVKAGGEAGEQDAVSLNVTPTASSNFQGLMRRLADLRLMWRLNGANSEADSPLQPAADANAASTCVGGGEPVGNSRFATNWCMVHNSAIVTFSHRLTVPEFVRLYLKLRWAGQHARLHKAGRALLRRLGDQATLPFVARMKGGVRMVMPVQVTLLSSEPTLMSARLRVVGKVVRRIDARQYSTLGLYTRFRPMLDRRFATVLERIGADRGQITDELKTYRPLRHPAALILPIAIFN